MSTIRFSIASQTETRLELTVRTTSETFELWFEFSESIDVPSSAIAIVAAALSGQSYQEIILDFPVESRVLGLVRAFTQSPVQASLLPDKPHRHRAGTLLSFSGGFDSLAALAVMPRDTKLVSIDFGGHFCRESEYFTKFNPLIVATNVRQTPLVHNSWAFMYLGAALCSDHFNTKYHSFGSILASSISKAPAAGSFSLIRASGMIGADFVRGITEVATVSIILQAFPDELRRSLSSLAGPQDPKRTRKSLLTAALAKQFSAVASIDDAMTDDLPTLQFGNQLADDFVTSYLIAESTGTLTAHHLTNIPQWFQDAVTPMSLGFMHRYNPDFYRNFPTELLPGLFKRFAELGIYSYLSSDWPEFASLRQLLLDLHPAVANRG